MDKYIEIENQLNVDFLSCKKKKNLLSNFRLLFFVFTIILSYYYFTDFILIYLFLGLISFILFLFFVSKSVKCTKQLLFINDQLLVLSEIKIDDKIDLYSDLNDKYFSNIYNKDLDILDRTSLFNRINKTQSYVGNFRLKHFLSHLLLNKEDILNRQKSIEELAKKHEWNLNFLTLSKRVNLDRFVIFKSFDRQFKNYALRFIPLIYSVLNLFVFVFLAINGFEKKGVFFWVVSVVVVSFLVNLFFKSRINKTLSYSFINAFQLENLIELVECVENVEFKAGLNNQISGYFENDGVKASTQLKKVRSAIGGLDALGFPIVGFVLNNFFLWKLYHVIQFENNVSQVIENNKKWIEGISILEALISFSIFNEKNESFTKPEISDLVNDFVLEEAFHPLLDYKTAVKNTFKSNRAHNISIITGANMAGKSTFLRTIGVNLVLAMNGVNVSAEKMKFFPMDIFTSIRTVDNLASGDSYFKNEINKLKLLIERLDSSKPQFIILDEILKGTNSKDKLIGSQKFLEKLIKSKASLICFIATHDLELTKLEEVYPLNVVNYCFELKNVEDNFFSDYKLRKGTTEVMNAIFLLKKFNIIE